MNITKLFHNLKQAFIYKKKTGGKLLPPVFFAVSSSITEFNNMPFVPVVFSAMYCKFSVETLIDFNKFLLLYP